MGLSVAYAPVSAGSQARPSLLPQRHLQQERPLPHVTAFIPFYQRESGLLREAVLSMLNQSILHEGAAGPYSSAASDGWEPTSGAQAGAPQLGDWQVEILIVDDGSPISPATELADLEVPERCTIRIVEQENGGVAKCRNTGLDSVRPDTDYFALLDSDDAWSPWHLERAVLSLQAGADVYTANWITAETGEPAFESMDKIQLKDHRPHSFLENAFEFVGDPLIQEARTSIWRPSCLAFSWEVFGDLRNDPDQRYSSEDQLWRFEILARKPTTVFSTRPEVRSGVGVSIFSSLRWTTDRGLLALSDRGRCMRKGRQIPGFTPGARKIAGAVIGQVRRDQVASVLHMAARRQGPKLKTLFTMAVRDPLLAVTWPFYAAKIVMARDAKKGDQSDASEATPEVARWGE